MRINCVVSEETMIKQARWASLILITLVVKKLRR